MKTEKSKVAVEKNLVSQSKLVNPFSRRSFLQTSAAGFATLAFSQFGCSSQTNQNQQKSDSSVIQGFDELSDVTAPYKGWVPFSEKKIKVGLVGYGVCKFGTHFGFQDHPNVEVVAVSDLIPERCAEMAKVARCSKSYPSLEELVKDKTIEAVFVATDAPSHFRHCREVLKHGKHVAVAVPAVFGSLEDAEILYETVKSSGLKYMMFETSMFRESCYAMHKIYKSGGFGGLVYSEGEYYHYMETPIDSYNGWRIGLPPQFYPTHSNAFHICATGGSFTEVSCIGMPSIIDHLKPENNIYKNPFGTEIALFRTSEGGTARMAVSWDTPGDEGERGRVRGQKGSFYEKFEGLDVVLPDLNRPPLPPGMPLGGHGGSHGYLTNEFIHSILQDRKPLVDIAMALNLTVSGIVAHQSALKDGELMKIPQYKF
ncbi:MAG TPA: Gfo/Idh/MocA family oxidoreductase [Draconibacterium sp.]|nr:Gfo/Idh/MocA family oxidoreductase [Draconibacterium sp.]